MVLVRLLHQQDRNEWFRLRCALWPDDTTAEHEGEMAYILAHFEQMPVFVAERPSGGLCGMLEISLKNHVEGCLTDKIGYLEGWYVDAEWRQQGIGRQLVTAAETWCRQQGCLEMASDTTADYPISPLAHAKLGYKEINKIITFRKVLTDEETV